VQIVKSVLLKNFRSHDEFAADFTDGVSLIVGKNGTGKTSILEAVYLLLNGTSFKSKDIELIKNGKPNMFAEIQKTDGLTPRVIISLTDKAFKINGETSKKLKTEHRYPTVLFEPDDLNLIHNSPNARREYFDRFFGLLNTNYAATISGYKKAMTQRNKLLKSGFATTESVYSWDCLLAKYGSNILKLRTYGASQINQKISDTYNTISDTLAKVELQYSGRVIDEQEYLAILTGNFERDSIVGSTTFGPHRDDFLFIFNGKMAGQTASRGENRTIILAEKFIEASAFTNAKGVSPIILLDDVFSELDDKRQTALMSNFRDHQIIITAVAPPPKLNPLITL
jgi:DNA replication and repair protein RecF